MRNGLCWLLFVTVMAEPTIVLADDTAQAISAAAAKAQGGRNAEKTGRVPIATTLVAAEPAPLPVYIENWARLAEFTKSDRVVFAQADRWATRRWYAGSDLGALFLLGSGVAAIGTFDRLATNHWTNTSKWTLATGLSVAIVALITAWAILPDRDDFLTVINQWNARHPDRPLAP
jgi:hypothetical protein